MTAPPEARSARDRTPRSDSRGGRILGRGTREAARRYVARLAKSGSPRTVIATYRTMAGRGEAAASRPRRPRREGKKADPQEGNILGSRGADQAFRLAQDGASPTGQKRSRPARDKPERGHDAGAGADSGTAPSKVSVGTLTRRCAAPLARTERRESSSGSRLAREAGATKQRAEGLEQRVTEARLRAGRWPACQGGGVGLRAALSEREENWRRGKGRAQAQSAPQPELDLNPAVDARGR